MSGRFECVDVKPRQAPHERLRAAIEASRYRSQRGLAKAIAEDEGRDWEDVRRLILKHVNRDAGPGRDWAERYARYLGGDPEEYEVVAQPRRSRRPELEDFVARVEALEEEIRRLPRSGQ